MKSLGERYDEMSERLAKITYIYRYELYDKILCALPIHQAELFLDIGAGTGNFSLYLHERSKCRIICIDNSDEMIKRLSTKVRMMKIKRIEVCKGDLLNLPFRDGCSDISFSKFVLHDIKNKSRAVAEMVRVLKKGGYVCIVDLLTGDLNNLYNMLSNKLGITIESLSRSDTRPSLDELRRLMQVIDVNIEEEWELHFPIVLRDVQTIDAYFQLFGVYEGSDCPIRENAPEPEHLREKIIAILKDYFNSNTSLSDERKFGIVVGVKR